MYRCLVVAMLLGALLGGPALQVLAASDWFATQWPAYSYPLSVFVSYPLGFFVVAIFAYNVAIKPMQFGKAGGAAAYKAFVIAFITQALLVAVTWPLLFVIGEWYPGVKVLGLSFLGGLWALVVGTVNHSILKSGVPAKLEIAAHIVVGGATSLLLHFYAGDLNSAVRTHVFGAWPALVALLPFAILVALYAPRSTGFSAATLSLLFACAVPYLLKAVVDHQAGRIGAFTWPARVVSTFKTPREREAEFNYFLQRHRQGEPFSVGQHRFRVNRGLQEIWTGDRTPNKPITGFTVMVPASEIGIVPVHDTNRFLALNVRLQKEGEQFRNNSAMYFYAEYEGLALTMVRPIVTAAISEAELTAKIVEFVQRLKVSN